jgi:hypothetical protein
MDAAHFDLDGGRSHAHCPKDRTGCSVQRELTALARRGRVEARVQQRAKIELLAAQGWQNKDIAAEVGLDRRQVALWRQRLLEGGVEALMHDAPRPGRTPSVTAAEFESNIVDKTLHDRPIAATHWEHAHAGRAGRVGGHRQVERRETRTRTPRQMSEFNDGSIQGGRGMKALQTSSAVG